MSKLTALFANVLHINEDLVTPELSPENNPAWDSLNAILLVTEIEKAFGLKFSYDDVMAIKNFADVVSLLSARGIDPNQT